MRSEKVSHWYCKHCNQPNDLRRRVCINCDAVRKDRTKPVIEEKILGETPRYVICWKCDKPVVTLSGEGFHDGSHTRLKVHYCYRCRVLYIPKKITIDQIYMTDFDTKKIPFVKHQVGDKEKMQKNMGMI